MEEVLGVVRQYQGYDGNTAYKLYLDEIGQTPLLTIDEEKDLAEKIKRGDKAAREHMIKANLRLVVKIAHEYEGFGMPLLDLINEGNIGLMKGVERFDPTKGGKLSTYASYWIRQSIKRSLTNKSKTIRLPVHIVDKLFQMRKAIRKLYGLYGREPTDAELAEELGTTTNKIRALMTATIQPLSLDAPLGEDGNPGEFQDVIPDENITTPYEDLVLSTVRKMLHEFIRSLDQREATILRYRFGLDDGQEKTLEQVGKKFGVTRERIRQIQKAALIKLKWKIEKLERSGI